MPPPEIGAGSIYDLGYRHYDGVRLGRGNAIRALFWHSLKSAFGIGRGARAKIIPMGLAIVVFIPAAIQLGIAAISSGLIELWRPEDYYWFVFIIIALFIAAMAPELVGRDQRNRTLSLYFSRPLERRDYALAKLGAGTAAMLALTLGPQSLLFIGHWFAGNDFWGFFREEADTIGPIVGTAIMISVFMSGLGLAIASHSPRRAYASGGIVALVVITSAIAGISAEISEGGVFARVAVLLSPGDLVDGFTRWAFRAEPERDSTTWLVDLPGYVYAVAITAWAAVAGFLLLRRYQRISA